ncbi:MAG: hypothetical protein VW829_14880 [Deltaproteobacteria bacterium]
MKNSQSWKGLLIILGFFLGFASTAEAVGVRLQFLIPTGGSAEVNGFNEEDPQTSGLGLSLLLPATESLRIVAGYNYFAATIEETQDNATLSRKNDGAFYAHILEAGVEYTGIQLFTDYQLLLGLTARIPMSVDGSVKTTDKTNSTVDSTKLKSTEAVGGGVFANIGVSRGRWDVGIYYQGTSLEYELEVPQLSGETEKANVMLTEYGLSVGYRF